MLDNFSWRLRNMESKTLGHLPITPRATLSAEGNQEELQVEPIKNKEKVRTDSDWPESFGNRHMDL
jgi:hypothetical protein